MQTRKLIERGLMVLLIATATVLPVAADGGGPQTDFAIFDATQYRGKPDLTAYGIRPLPVVYGHFFWEDRKVKDDLPDKEFVKRLLSKASYQADIICLDVEHWKISAGSDNWASISKYIALLETARAVLPQSAIGYYGMPPKRDYFASIAGPQSKDFKAWERLNSNLTNLARHVDILFPSLYTFYRKPAEWERYAVNTIQACQRYGKPIYPFLWPQYHESNRRYGLDYIEPDFWRRQLETVARHAHGVVIWGGWDFAHQCPATWDEEAGWWQATKAFIQKAKSPE